MDSTITRLGRLAADLLCPERCAACPAIVPAGTPFCRSCRGRVALLGPPECDRCGLPGADTRAEPRDPAGRAAERGSEPPCPHGVPPAVRRARAWALYRDADAEPGPLAAAIAAFKYGGARRLAPRLGAALARRASTPVPDVVVPVPLHATRLRARGYNQSAALARAVARALDRPLLLDALVRTRDTPSQTGLGARARARNVADAFRLRGAAALTGRTVLLVDDVWTSGATAGAAAAALRAGGAAAVDVVTLARVP